MPQISLYIDSDTMQKVEKAARKEKISISKWVSNNIKKTFSDQYPSGFFDLFGKITDDSFQIDSLDFSDDLKREQF